MEDRSPQAFQSFCLDFSFYNITEVHDIEGDEPRIEESKGKSVKSAKKTAEGKYVAEKLKLDNNELHDLGGFMTVMEALLHNPIGLTWLDLSFNSIPKIDPVICELHNLKLLYFHGNTVADIKEVDKLAGLPALQKLSLHGNPIENRTQNYKCYVLNKIPQLKNFDMATVTKSDRRNMGIVAKLQPNQKRKKKAADE